MQRAHAIGNGVYVAAVNRIGHEGPADGGLEFWGGSFVADPFGRVLARAGRDTEEVLIVDLRPPPPGRHPPQLAVPPRPPDRRLRADHRSGFLRSDSMSPTRRSPTTQTPAALGYRMPAEWEPHAATWIAWPHNRDDWPGKFGPIPWVYAEIVRLLSRVERVKILVKAPRMTAPRGRPARRGAASTSSRVAFVKAATDRVWTRDSGPTFVVNDHAGATRATASRLVDWQFNGWAKYDNHRRDDRVPRKLARRLGLQALGAEGRDRTASRAASSWKGARSTSTAGGRC